MNDPGYWPRTYATEDEAEEAKWESFSASKGMDSEGYDKVEEVICFIERELGHYAKTENWQKLREMIEWDYETHT